MILTAGTEKKAEVTSNKVFNNNLNITKSTVDGTYGTSKGIHVDATGTWIKYTITVNASNVNQDDASGVKVTDVFSDDKEDIEQYYAIEGATQTNSTEPGAGEIYIDNNKKDFIWNIGTMKKTPYGRIVEIPVIQLRRSLQIKRPLLQQVWKKISLRQQQ